ncbi:GEVED domain-containing protein [Niabella sp. CJ426]|uniref:GEVED domain-containing protein n=1 Tax=Niabella sp. CJ426 TaxID=3393740 RepID=UPI003D068433
MKFLILPLTALLISFVTVRAQTYGTCNFNGTNSTSGNVVVAREVSSSFPIVPQNLPATVVFGNNASTSVSGLNEVEVIAGDITNSTGGDLSEIVIPIKGIAFWTQNVAGTQFRYLTWNVGQQRFEGILGDGRSVYVTVLGGKVNGTDLPASQIQLMPYNSAASGYTFATTAAVHPTASFTDGGSGTVYSTSPATQSMPTSLLSLKSGPVANGATISDVSVKLGLQIVGGGDAWVNYAADSGPGDYDYYFYLDATFMGIPYDYGDAPASYGIAKHAYAMCANPLYLGSARPDYEISTGGSALVNADNTNTSGYNDEDVTAVDYTGTNVYTFTVPYTNSTGSPAYISGWIDWNNNGIFEASEHATATIPAGGTSINLTWRSSGAATGEGTIPSGVTTGYKITRLRIGSSSAEINSATGTATNGEVEDLRINVVSVLPVTFGNIEAYIQNNRLFVNWQSLQEVNNDHYTVEVSTDGEHFQSIGTVVSKTGGDSSIAVSYSFTKDLTGGIVIGTVFLSIALLGSAGKRKRWTTTAAIIMLTGIGIVACKKDATTSLNAGEKLFVRIAQSDKDGTVSYSKVVQIIRR